MLCSRCGSPLGPTAAFCNSCGTPTGLGAGAPLARPRVVTLLAVLQALSGATLLVLGVLLGMGLAGPEAARPAPLAALLVALGGLQVACAIGLWRLRPFGRTLQIALGVVGLLGFPIGTVVYGLVLWLFSKPGAKVLFSGRTAAQLSQQEATEVAEFGRGTLATAVSVIVILVVLIVPLVGMMAAVAIPGLLRARMSGNEASAIGSVRSVISAQLTFSATCGHGYFAADLASLSVPEPGGMAFVSPDLSGDPSVKSGYTIALVGGAPVADAPPACNGARVVQTFFVSAAPLEPGTTGARYFGANQEALIYQSTSPVPVTQEGAPAGATPLQ